MAKQMNRMPVAVTISREDGKILEVRCEDVTRESFTKICRELLKAGRKAAGEEAGDEQEGMWELGR